jgi:hypothetical protein
MHGNWEIGYGLISANLQDALKMFFCPICSVAYMLCLTLGYLSRGEGAGGCNVVFKPSVPICVNPARYMLVAVRFIA